jgi:hypothetical protein
VPGKVNGASKVRRRTIVLDADVRLDKNLNVFSKGQNPITLLRFVFAAPPRWAKLPHNP